MRALVDVFMNVTLCERELGYWRDNDILFWRKGFALLNDWLTPRRPSCPAGRPDSGTSLPPGEREGGCASEDREERSSGVSGLTKGKARVNRAAVRMRPSTGDKVVDNHDHRRGRHHSLLS
jgi:hypothetical protein